MRNYMQSLEQDAMAAASRGPACPGAWAMARRTARKGTLLALAALLAAASAVHAGDIVGTVKLAAKKAAKGPHRVSLYPGEAEAESAPSERGPAIVFVEVPGSKPVPVKAEMAQDGRQFKPLALGIPVGTTVNFPNHDKVQHNVFSREGPKQLELGRYGQGESRDVTFDKPGVVKLLCEVHDNMHGIIVVVDTPFVTVTDTQGHFKLPGVPAGKYTVYVVQEDLEVEGSKDRLHATGNSVDVPASGTATVDFSL